MSKTKNFRLSIWSRLIRRTVARKANEVSRNFFGSGSSSKAFGVSERIQYLYQKAAKCRRLARAVGNTETVVNLNKLADEYEGLAREEDAVEASQSKTTSHYNPDIFVNRIRHV